MGLVDKLKAAYEAITYNRITIAATLLLAETCVISGQLESSYKNPSILNTLTTGSVVMGGYLGLMGLAMTGFGTETRKSFKKTMQHYQEKNDIEVDFIKSKLGAYCVSQGVPCC